MKMRTLGKSDLTVSALGLGCMGMSDLYGTASSRDDATSLDTIHAALDAGITLFDTGDFYGSGHNESLLSRALAARRAGTVVSVKFGVLRTPGGGFGGIDGRPAAVRNFAAYSLRRLGVGVIDIYQPARLDPAVPLEDTIGAIADLIREGKVRYLGVSELRRGSTPARSCGASGHRAGNRILAGLPRHRTRDPAGRARARDRGHRIRRIVTRPAVGRVGHDIRSRRFPRPRTAIPGHQSGTQPRKGRRTAGHRAPARHHTGPARDRVAARPGRRHRAADRHGPARAPCRESRRTRCRIDRRRARGARDSLRARCVRRRALPGRADEPRGAASVRCPGKGASTLAAPSSPRTQTALTAAAVAMRRARRSSPSFRCRPGRRCRRSGA